MDQSVPRRTFDCPGRGVAQTVAQAASVNEISKALERNVKVIASVSTLAMLEQLHDEHTLHGRTIKTDLAP